LNELKLTFQLFTYVFVTKFHVGQIGNLAGLVTFRLSGLRKSKSLLVVRRIKRPFVKRGASGWEIADTSVIFGDFPLFQPFVFENLEVKCADF
jgi:hypothetical protein